MRPLHKLIFTNLLLAMIQFAGGANAHAVLLSQYLLNQNGDDSLSNSPAAFLAGTSFSANALYLPDSSSYSAEFPIPGLSYSSFAFALDFNPCTETNSANSTIISGGPLYRWIGLRISGEGFLELQLNNSALTYVFTNRVARGEWHTVAISMSISQAGDANITGIFDGKLLPPIALSGFTFEVVGTDAEASDRAFSFVNGGDASHLCGYAKNFRVYSEALSDSELMSLGQTPNDDFYSVRFLATYLSTNSSGLEQTKSYRAKDMISDCGYDPGACLLLFNRGNDSVEVVRKSDLAVLCSPLVFGSSSSTTNRQGTIHRLSMVSFHGSSTPNGTFRRTEKVKDAGGDSAFHLTGHLDFFAPGSDPGVVIYSGTLTTIGKWPAQ